MERQTARIRSCDSRNNQSGMKLNRRSFIHSLGALAVSSAVSPRTAEAAKRTTFQVACMTLPYSQFPLERALSGIRDAGYKFVAWGTTHKDAAGRDFPVIGTDAAPINAAELAKNCRDQGLQPVMMFSGIYPEHADAVRVFKSRIEQAEAAGISQILTFGHTEGANRDLWIKRFRELGPVAQDHGVLIVIKQHGGESGTGAACARIVAEINHPSVKVNYDAGNVMDYLDLDPLKDIQSCASEIRSFCIKDHRNFPKDEDCGPGFGEIDHYKLLNTVTATGLTMPLCCENIFAPGVPRPRTPEAVDSLARRAREFLELVIQALQG